MRWLKLGVAVACWMLALAAPVAQADLVAGDVAIIRAFTDNPDSFAWVAMVDISEGQQVHFTDAGWNNNDYSFSASEGIVTFTAPAGGIAAGSVSSYTIGATNLNYTHTGTFDLQSAGDQVIAYQGSVISPTFLFAAQTNSNQFQAAQSASGDSELPIGLEVGVTAVALGVGPGSGDEIDNAYYSGTVEGTREELLQAISDPANWTRFDLPNPTAEQFAALPSHFTIEGVAAVPEASSLLVGGMVALVSLIATGIVGLKRRRPAVAPVE